MAIGGGIGSSFFPTAPQPIVESHFSPDGSGYKITRPYEGAPPSKISVVGPRLKSLDVAFSTWGQPIPISFGVKRLRGQPIWGAPLTERSHKQTRTLSASDLAGGPITPSFNLPGLSNPWLSATVLKEFTYHYFGDWAVSLGIGDPTAANKKLQQIYMNGKLIYDAGDPDVASDTFRRSPVRFFPDLRFRFYSGTETQMPDPLIQSFENRRWAEAHSLTSIVNVVSPYRGQMYIVFEKVPLAPFGNTIPVVDVVLADVVTLVDLSGTYDGLPVDPPISGTQGLGVDWNTHLLYSVYNGFIHSVDLNTNSVVGTVLMLSGLTGAGYKNFVYSQKTGKAYATIENAGSVEVHEIDVTTGIGTVVSFYRDQLGMGPYKLPFTSPQKLLPVPYINSNGDLEDEVFIVDGTAGTNIYSTSSLFRIVHQGGFTRGFIVPGPVTQNQPTVFWVPNATEVHKFGPDVIGGFAHFFTPADSFEIASIIYVEQYGVLMVASNSPSADSGRLQAILPDGSALWTKNYPDPFNPIAFDNSNYNWASDTSAPTLLFPIQGSILEIDVRNGETIAERNLTFPASSFVVSSSIYGAIFALTSSHYYDRMIVGRTNMRDFLLFAGRVAGLDVDGIDAQLIVQTTIADIIIDGAYITETGLKFRRLLDNLSTAFLFSYREVEGAIHVIKKPPLEGPNDFAFTKANLLIQNTSTDVLVPGQRSSGEEIPSLLNYYFLDYDLNYEQNFVPARRISFPHESNESDMTAEVVVPIIMRYNEAMAWASKVLYKLWTGRNSYTVLLPTKQLKYEPGDTGTITIEGKIYSLEIQRIMYNADFSLQADCTSFVPEGGFDIRIIPTTRDVQKLLPQAFTIPLLLDIPMIYPNAGDFGRLAGGAQIYVAGVPSSPSGEWAGGTLYISIGGGMFEPVDDVYDDTGPKAGYSTNILGPHGANQIWSTDSVNTLTVRFGDQTFTPTSKSYSDWIKGIYNVLLYGSVPVAPDRRITHEIIVARTVEDNGDGTFTFSNFMRGRRGTNPDMNRHIAPARVLYIPPLSLSEKVLHPNGLDEPVRAAATTFGGLDLLPPRVTTLAAFTGQAGKPFTPNRIKATIESSNLVLRWERQSRAPSEPIEITNETDDLPSLWEDREFYSLAFYPDEATFDADWQYDPWNNGKLDIDGLPLVEQGKEIMDDAFREVLSEDAKTCTITPAVWLDLMGESDFPSILYLDIAQMSVNWGRGKGRRIKVYVE